MTCLFDTNLLVRMVDPDDSMHMVALEAIAVYRSKTSCRCATQNFTELWNVLTRPKGRNGLGRQPSDAARLCGILQMMAPVLDEPAETFRQWFRLVSRYAVRGVQVHDARLVVVMLVHSVDTILTFNTADFRRYEPEGIRVVDPSDV